MFTRRLIFIIAAATLEVSCNGGGFQVAPVQTNSASNTSQSSQLPPSPPVIVPALIAPIAVAPVAPTSPISPISPVAPISPVQPGIPLLKAIGQNLLLPACNFYKAPLVAPFDTVVGSTSDCGSDHFQFWYGSDGYGSSTLAEAASHASDLLRGPMGGAKPPSSIHYFQYGVSYSDTNPGVLSGSFLVAIFRISGDGRTYLVDPASSWSYEPTTFLSATSVSDLKSAFAKVNICQVKSTSGNFSLQVPEGVDPYLHEIYVLTLGLQNTQLMQADFLGAFWAGYTHSYICGEKLQFRNVLKGLSSGFNLENHQQTIDSTAPKTIDLFDQYLWH